jgi:transposase
VDLYLKVRLACSEGMSQREAAKHFNLSRDTVRKMLSFSVPPGYRRQAEISARSWTGSPASSTASGKRIAAPLKQRHTAKRIFDRLKKEFGFTGGYTIVKEYVRDHERRNREMFVPLAHPPGHAQADFGEAVVIIGGVEQKAHFFAFDLPHSDARMCGPILRRLPRRGWTATSTPLPSSARSRCRSL